jgi:hypothetical protein
MKFSMTRKMWPLNTGDRLIEVTVWTGLTVFVQFRINMRWLFNSNVIVSKVSHTVPVIEKNSSIKQVPKCFIHICCILKAHDTSSM